MWITNKNASFNFNDAVRFGVDPSRSLPALVYTLFRRGLLEKPCSGWQTKRTKILHFCYQTKFGHPSRSLPANPGSGSQLWNINNKTRREFFHLLLPLLLWPVFYLPYRHAFPCNRFLMHDISWNIYRYISKPIPAEMHMFQMLCQKQWMKLERISKESEPSVSSSWWWIYCLTKLV